VDFLVAGTQKAGTSALDAYLREHPEICMARRKEAHFFDNDELFGQPDMDYTEYHNLFSPQPPQRVLGESTPIYMYWRDAPKRIWQYNPAMKLIVVLRNPITRAFSHWNMERHRRTESLPFHEALQREPERRRDALPYQDRVFSYIDRGFYSAQLQRLWVHFHRSQTLVLRQEDLRTQPGETLNAVCRFLGVGRMERVGPRTVHSLPYPSAMSTEEWTCLKSIFEHDIRALERLFGWEGGDWLQHPDAGDVQPRDEER
jgi:hypothetical protein